jgi:hypothetical protein
MLLARRGGLTSDLDAGGAIIEVPVNFTTALDELCLGTMTMVGGVEELIGKIMPFLDCRGYKIDAGLDSQSLARTENWQG